ncbi:MAG: hypothetical protein D6731_13645 [Planctomycetota bacterium]|nr:MAG: hypothetical protein D6731_13645 [Planctomycetota bacterium]
MTPPRPLTALLVALALAGPALAEFETPADRTTYRLRGEDDRRGSFSSVVTVDPGAGEASESVEVVRTVRYDADPERVLIQRGVGRVENGVLRATLRTHRGAAGVVGNEETAPPTHLELELSEGRLESSARTGESESHAAGSAAEAGAADDRGDAERTLGRFVQKGKHLLAVAEEAVKERIRKEGDRLVYDGVKLERDFGVSRFLHVGVGGKVRALRDSELTPEQIHTSQRAPDRVWLVNAVHGGVRVPLSTSIPVGEVTIGVGLTAAARVDYEVTDLYPIPEGVSRDGLETALEDLRRMATRSFDLPIDADEALRMNVGARRVFDGQGSVAISGSLGIGYDVVDYGTRNDSGITARDVSKTIKIGASAHVGGFYRIQGDVRISVERLLADRVRVRVRRGKTSSRGASANLFLGASVDRAALADEFSPAIDYIEEGLVSLEALPSAVRELVVDEATDALTGAVSDKVRQVLRFRLAAGASESLRDEIDVSYVCDLAAPAGREAYERAVRGDFTRAAALSLEPDSGVYQEFRVLEVEEHTHLGVNLDLSVLLSAGASRDVRVSTLDVEDAKGARNYEIFRFERRRHLRFFRKRHKRMKVEVIRRELLAGDPADRVRTSLRFSLDILDPHTFSWEGNPVKRLLAFLGLDGEGAIPTGPRRFGHSRYGETRFRLRAEISDRGLRRALSASDERLFLAYVAGYTVVHGEEPSWADPDERERLEWAWDEEDSSDDFARAELDRAEDFVKSVGKLRDAGDAEARAKALERLAKSAKFDHIVLAAFMDLVPRDAVSLDASFLGDRVRIVDGRRSGEELVRVDDPRR